MLTTIPVFALAGIGDIPLLYWFFVPTFVVENHSAPVMVVIQAGGLAILGWLAARLLLKQKLHWRSRRLLILTGYPLFVFATNLIGLVYDQW
jgi:hypothetical protein